MENLSTKLFKPQQRTKETSTLIGSLEQYQAGVHSVLDGESDSCWYRVLRRPQWAWMGLDTIRVDQTLARIAASTNERSHENLLDTVTGYRPGNWSYEWSRVGAKKEKLAVSLFEQNKLAQAGKQWLQASQYFSLAAYPYLKGDTLAMQAEVLAAKAFNAAVNVFPYKIKSIVTEVDGKPLEGMLYLPHTNEPLATVIVTAGFDCLQTDLWHLFETYFAPANLAMLTLDMPSIGRSSRWNLTEDTSKLHQAMLKHLADVPWVDHHRVGCLGIRIGANAAVRLAFVEPSRLKSCVSLGGILHTPLCNLSTLKKMSPMQLDTLASRMGKEVSPTLLTRLQALSLKHQGLFGGRPTPVPILALSLTDDPISPEMDSTLAALYSQHGKAKILPSSPMHEGYHRVMLETIAWFSETL